MKKSFLIAGLIAGLTATNGYAVAQQTVVVVYTCPDGCELVKNEGDSGFLGVGVDSALCVRGEEICGNPTVSILETSTNPALQSEIAAQLQKQTKKSVGKKRQKVSSANRAAKKLIYKEVVFDEPVTLTEKDLEYFEM